MLASIGPRPFQTPYFLQELQKVKEARALNIEFTQHSQAFWEEIMNLARYNNSSTLELNLKNNLRLLSPDFLKNKANQLQLHLNQMEQLILNHPEHKKIYSAQLELRTKQFKLFLDAMNHENGVALLLENKVKTPIHPIKIHEPSTLEKPFISPIKHKETSLKPSWESLEPTPQKEIPLPPVPVAYKPQYSTQKISEKKPLLKSSLRSESSQLALKKPETPQEKYKKEADKSWFGFFYTQAIKYIVRPLAFIGAAIGGIFETISRGFGIVSDVFQYRQGHYQGKQGKFQDSVMTKFRAVLQFATDAISVVYVFVKQTVLGIIGAALSIVSSVISIAKYTGDVYKNRAERQKIRKEAISLNQPLTEKQQIKLQALKKDSKGQKIAIGSRVLFISANAMTIGMIATGVVGVAALLSNPVGWAILGVTLVGVVLHLISSRMRLQAKAALG